MRQAETGPRGAGADRAFCTAFGTGKGSAQSRFVGRGERRARIRRHHANQVSLLRRCQLDDRVYMDSQTPGGYRGATSGHERRERVPFWRPSPQQLSDMTFISLHTSRFLSSPFCPSFSVLYFYCTYIVGVGYAYVHSSGLAHLCFSIGHSHTYRTAS
ncbi:hypothetical protein C8Q79DRAFT_696550 [Trametes meyenii]|nr:hypothetical protein C8Q79DRAFT_696550 [Trametes meyenii]